MVMQTDATFQEVFSQVSSSNSIKLLPWCVFFSVPLHYMSRVLATTMEQDEDVPATTTASESEGSLAPGPSSSQAHPTRTPQPPVTPLQDILSVGTPPMGCPFAEFLASPKQKKQACSTSGSLSNHCDKRVCVDSQEVEARSEHSSAQCNEDTPKLVLEAGPSFNKQQGQGPISTPLVKPEPPLILMMVLWQEAQGVPGIRPYLTQTHQGRIQPFPIWIQTLETASHTWTQMK